MQFLIDNFGRGVRRPGQFGLIRRIEVKLLTKITVNIIIVLVLRDIYFFNQGYRKTKAQFTDVFANFVEISSTSKLDNWSTLNRLC